MPRADESDSWFNKLSGDERILRGRLDPPPAIRRNDDEPFDEVAATRLFPRDRGEVEERRDGRWRIVSRQGNDPVMEAHTGSLRNILGRIAIYETHKECLEAWREMMR